MKHEAVLIGMSGRGIPEGQRNADRVVATADQFIVGRVLVGLVWPWMLFFTVGDNDRDIHVLIGPWGDEWPTGIVVKSWANCLCANWIIPFQVCAPPPVHVKTLRTPGMPCQTRPYNRNATRENTIGIYSS